MANEVPGLSVPEAFVARMRRADSPEAAAAEGTAIAREIVAQIRGRVQGLQIGTVPGRVAAALDVLDGLV
jgi:hypothetical protein